MSHEKDVLAGVAFDDPYRWLEQENEDVRQWDQAQARAASAWVREWPRFEQVRHTVAKFNHEPRHGEQFRTLPRYCAEAWFRVQVASDGACDRVIVSGEPYGEGRMIFDAASERASGKAFVSWISPSPDGKTLALGLCEDGSENNTMRLVDVATARLLDDPPPQKLMDNWTGGAQWLPDSSGFLFSGILDSATDFTQEIFLHTRSPAPPTTTRTDVAWTRAKDYRWVVVQPAARFALVMEGLLDPKAIAFASLTESPLRWRPFLSEVSGRIAGQLVGERYIAVTDVGAPRGRLVSVSLSSRDRNDVESWQELIAESDAVMLSVMIVGEHLYLTELIDTYARVRILGLDGRSHGEVPLPGRGALGSGWSSPMHSTVFRGHPGKFMFTFSTFIQSPGVFCHTPGEPRLETLRAPAAQLAEARVEDRWAVAADGTRIPYHIVYRAGLDRARPQPALIYGYGAYNYSLMPQFPGPMAAVVEFDGIYVHAHLRGGGELGIDWWKAGHMASKQTSYDDLYAIAEDLIKSGITTSQLLAVTGKSGGGLMAGIALTQRPDLWRVVIPRVPLLDLIGACRGQYGRMAVSTEFADVEDPEDVRRLATLSPYHLVREGVSYPAVFIAAGASDPRCPPWHARKLAARLQATGNAFVLLHVWENAGHGAANDANLTVEEHSEWLAFTLRHLGR